MKKIFSIGILILSEMVMQNCFAQSQQQVTTSTRTSVGATDWTSNQTWSSTANAANQDGTFSTVTLGSAGNETSDYLKLTNWNFNLAGPVTITGIVVEIKMKVSPFATPGVVNHDLRLVKGGSVLSAMPNYRNIFDSDGDGVGDAFGHPVTGDFNSQSRPSTLNILHAFPNGGRTNFLWGTTWTEAEIENAGFGFAYAAKNQSGTTDGILSVDGAQITVYYSALMPVELTHWEARQTNDNKIRLNWLTASQINNDFFTIEKSYDGINWFEFRKIDGKGTISAITSYIEFDNEPQQGVNYYRLKQTDFDGKFEIFNSVSVNFDLNNAEWMFLNPNAISASDNINLELTNLPSGNDVSVHLYDLKGNAVFSTIIPLGVNAKEIISSIDVPDILSAGIYSLIVSSGNRSRVKRVIIY